MKPDATVIEAIAFDLDGTLVDSAPDIAWALNSALRRAGLTIFDLETVREWIGDGPDLLIARALAAGPAAGAEPTGLPARLRRDFDAVTFSAPLQHGAVYPDITDTVRTLRDGRPLVVVTNKPTALARAVLQTAGLLPWFTAVYGADRAELRKPLPAMLDQAAHDLGLRTGQLLMVGDSAADMNAAKAAGAQAALVSWGYGHLHAQSLGTWWMIHRPQQLNVLLQESERHISPLQRVSGDRNANRR